MKNGLLSLCFLALLCLPQWLSAQEGDCEDCNVFLFGFTEVIDGCSALFCAHFKSDKSCGEATYEWDFGDGIPVNPDDINGDLASHHFNGNGTYNVCVTYTVTSPLGEECSLEHCEEIEITDCNDCCGLQIDNIVITQNPSDSCTVSIGVSGGASNLCSDYETLYDYDGDGTIDGIGSVHTYNTPGPHTACVTLQKDSCEVTECTTFELEGCEGTCAECNLQAPNLTATIEGCKVYLSTWGEGASDPCHSPSYNWNTGDPNSPDPDDVPIPDIAIHNYSENGTYTACLTYTVINSLGEECSITSCIDVEITDCDGCCDIPLEILDVWQWSSNPCYGYIKVSSSDGCLDYEILYDYDGDGTNDGTNPIHVFDGPGPHTVCVTRVEPNCETSACFGPFDMPGCGEGPKPKEEIRPSARLSTTNSPLNVFPNPAKDIINISIGESERTINIVDVSGQIVLKQEAASNSINSIDIANLPLGIYFIQTIDPIGRTTLERFVKIQ